MARPSKLSEKQWQEIEKRHLAGETTGKLAKEFKVGNQTIRDRVSVKSKQIKEFASQIVDVETKFSRLPVSVQISVRTLADELKSISSHLASAGSLGAMTAHKLSQLANTQANKIDDVNPLESVEELKTIAALTDIANKASMIGIGLINANKGKEAEKEKSLNELTDDELEAIASGR